MLVCVLFFHLVRLLLFWPYPPPKKMGLSCCCSRGAVGNGAGALFVFFFASHACVVVALPPSPLRPQPHLVVGVGLSRGVGHPFSKDPP
jgi:hypothetical protein